MGKREGIPEEYPHAKVSVTLDRSRFDLLRAAGDALDEPVHSAHQIG